MIGTRPAFLITLALALLAGLAGALVAVRMTAAAPPHGDALHVLLHEELGLSSAQRQRIDAEERVFAARKAAREAAIRQANAGLAAAIRTSGRNGPEVQAATDEVHRELGAYQKETVAHVFRMREVLTSQQTKRFDATVSDALTNDAR